LETKELLQEIIAYLKTKYSLQGVAISNQTNGDYSSAIFLALKDEEEKVFKIVLTKVKD